MSSSANRPNTDATAIRLWRATSWAPVDHNSETPLACSTPAVAHVSEGAANDGSSAHVLDKAGNTCATWWSGG